VPKVQKNSSESKKLQIFTRLKIKKIFFCKNPESVKLALSGFINYCAHWNFFPFFMICEKWARTEREINCFYSFLSYILRWREKFLFEKITNCFWFIKIPYKVHLQLVSVGNFNSNSLKYMISQWNRSHIRECR
jgi:hypothetical protein